MFINTLQKTPKAKQTVSRIGSYWGQSAEMHKEPHFNAQKFNKRMLATPGRVARSAWGLVGALQLLLQPVARSAEPKKKKTLDIISILHRRFNTHVDVWLRYALSYASFFEHVI